MASCFAPVFALTLLIHSGLVWGADDAPSVPGDTPTQLQWWESAFQAAGAALGSMPSAETAIPLDEMLEVKQNLSKRLSNLRHRLGPDLLGQLADRGVTLTVDDLYSRIPLVVRLAGERATMTFLRPRDLSHIASIENAPQKALNSENLVYEKEASNRARGSANMTLPERTVNWVQNLPAGVEGARVLMLSTAKGVGFGALLEVPVTVAVETLHVVYQDKEVDDAAWDALQEFGAAAVAGGATTGALTVASAYGFTVGAPVVIPLVVIGGTAYVFVSGERVWQALDDETRGELQAQLEAVQTRLVEFADRAGLYQEPSSKGR